MTVVMVVMMVVMMGGMLLGGPWAFVRRGGAAETTDRGWPSRILRALGGVRTLLLCSRENDADVSAPIPPEEFAALVGASPEQVEQWRREGLLDPEGLGRFDELDLVRWLTIRGHEARGYRSNQLAARSEERRV